MTSISRVGGVFSKKEKYKLMRNTKMKNGNMKSYLAEFIGTFFLVFNGTGAIIINSLTNNSLGGIGISLIFGFTIIIMIYACGHISGAHFNPAVTLAFLAIKKITIRNSVVYILIQIFAAIFASSILWLLFGNIEQMGATLPTPKFSENFVLTSFAVEMIFTYCLVFVIFNVALDPSAESNFTGLAVGITIIVGALFIGPISGGSFNPARSIGPAIIANNYDHLWIYIISPIIGSLLAVLSFKMMNYKMTVCQNTTENRGN